MSITQMRAKMIFDEHVQVLQALQSNCIEDIVKFAEIISTTLANGNTIFFMGNGGSAADSQHLAAEFVGRFKIERKGLAAIALTTDTSILTAVGNDYGFEEVFARQVQALVRPGDTVVGLSTSGNSPNVVKALDLANELGAVTIGLTGKAGGVMNDKCNICIKVPSDVTARIQELHILIGHTVCDLVDGGVLNRV